MLYVIVTFYRWVVEDILHDPVTRGLAIFALVAFVGAALTGAL